MKKRWIVTPVIILVAVALIWLLTTPNLQVWAARNTVQYHVYTWWWELTGQLQVDERGDLEGAVLNAEKQPIQGAWVLVSEWDGVTHIDRSDSQGNYVIPDIPVGSYRPVATAPGYRDTRFGGEFGQARIRPDSTTIANFTLAEAPNRSISPGTDLSVAAPTTQTCDAPLESRAVERQVHFKSDGEPNQPTFYYTPVTATTTSRLPILLTVYPGPADSWVCASLPLAEAGYGVLAAGPAYTFDFEGSVDELERLLMFARDGQFPGGDETSLAMLGGSYSGLHVLRLLQRGGEFEAALLLGPPTDLFEMRRLQESGEFIAPFGLSQAFIAMGFPSHNPLLYLRYSGAYHVRSDYPPLAILHSRSDDVVPPQQSELLARNLDLVGAEYELHLFDEGGHYLLGGRADADTLAIYETSLDFLAKHLK